MMINNVLMINPLYYASQEEDIEYLFHSRDIVKIVKAAEKCEKFHSYFHYEESFFNTLYAGLVDDGREYLEKAVKLSPVNKRAIELLMEIEPERAVELELKLEAIKAVPPVLERPYPTFLDYMKFATENPSLERADLPDNHNYWQLYDKYLEKEATSILEHTMHDLEARHILYHKEAAKIYHTAYLYATSKGDEALAQFALTKARNLDPAIV